MKTFLFIVEMKQFFHVITLNFCSDEAIVSL
jgi:hypothetical protein